MVDWFLRGFEKGTRYGPQLHELNHNCISDKNAMFLRKARARIDKSLDARVVRGKLLFHGVHWLSVSLSAEPPETLASQVDISQINFSDRLVPAIHAFREIGCAHSRDTLPAILLDAFQLRDGCAANRTRSLDLLNCGQCATNMLIRVDVDHSGLCVQIEVEIWQSFGGRKPENRDETEEAHFNHQRRRLDPFNISHPPDRDREEMFKRGVEGEPGSFGSPDQPRRRQS